jgi:hypothetical protein
LSQALRKEFTASTSTAMISSSEGRRSLR